LLVGYVAKGKLSPFNYVLSTGADYRFGGVANVEIIDGLTFDLFAGQKADGENKANAAVALTYKFIPELGIKLKGAASKPASGMFENYAAGIGLFGEVAGIDYTADFAMDFKDNNKEKNYLGVATLSTELGGIKLDGKFVYQEENYGIANQLVDDKANNKLGIEGGLSTEISVLKLGARAYYEGAGFGKSDDIKGTNGDATTDKSIVAVKADASASFDLFVPVTLSGEVVAGRQGGDDFKTRALAKLEIAKKGDYGLRYGANAAFEKNKYNQDSPSWKNPAHIGDETELRLGANIGYGADLSGAKLDLDYAATFVMPVVDKDADKPNLGLNHKVDLVYAFTDNVKLTLGGTVKQTIDRSGEEASLTNNFGYSAGLTVSF
jgi:hypothetical protein